ncbi:MAG: rRNA processing protein RimM [Acidimicrobiaceae bacterium]|nr:rRNA processing protein RimM [Acidimicrobiaceae bacterium]
MPAESQSRPATLQVGIVVKPHGLRGEVVVQLLTNRLERLDVGTRLACSRPAARTARGASSQPPAEAGGADPSEDVGPVGAPWPSELEVTVSRPHQGRHLVHFAGITSFEQAEALRGAVLEAEPLEDPDAYFVHELIGCEVIDGAGVRRGKVTAVEANPASDLLVVGDSHYVPLRFVVERRPGELLVDVPDGLFD